MASNLVVPKDRLAKLCQKHSVRRLALFGSAIRDDFGPDSDIDILVDFQPGSQVGFIALSHLARELSQLFGRPVDLVPRDGLKVRIRDSVLAHTEVLFAA
jgi:uncharacterized protein